MIETESKLVVVRIREMMGMGTPGVRKKSLEVYRGEQTYHIVLLLNALKVST